MRCSTVVAVMIGSAMAMEVMACDALVTHPRTDLAAHPAALRIFWGLLEQGRFGFSEVEHTAFIVQGDDGTIGFVAWPDAGEPNNCRWMGAFPKNVIAIAHTHPNWLPAPSFIDVRTALRSNVPVYVITRAHIAKTMNGSTTMVMDGDWKPGAVCRTADARRPRRSETVSGH
jgi:hypothetical protein